MAKKRPRKHATSSPTSNSPAAQRLNKILAAAGLGSRRKVEELIEQGRVDIDGHIVTDLACKVDPAAVKIKVDGILLKRSRPVYFALNKPSGVLSTNYDPSGRMRVVDLVPDRDRVFSVGRLDQSSEGLMLLTNDGEIAQRLAHPRFRIQKTYFVVVSGQLLEEELAKLRKGVHFAEGLARIDGATIKKHRKGCTEMEIVLSEGKNREIRRMLAKAGHKVVLLRRIAIGPLRLGQLPLGASRTLTSAEVKALYAATDPDKRPKRKPAKGISRGSPRQAESREDEAEGDLLNTDLPGSDDDFVGDLSGNIRAGSIIRFDEDADVPSGDSGDRPRARPERMPKRASGSSQRKNAPQTKSGFDSKSKSKSYSSRSKKQASASSGRIQKSGKLSPERGRRKGAARKKGGTR